MFWIIYIIVMVIDLLVVKLITLKDSNVFKQYDGEIILSILSILCPFIPVINWVFLFILFTLFLLSVDWIQLAEKFYRVKKK